MKLQEIRLKNFRQFYGRQVLRISTDPAKNLTLIHAENGFGKTTLLNALLWCFYDTTTAKFENKDELVNFAALEEGESEASVEVMFDHEGQIYLAQRTVVRGRERRSRLQVFAIENGNYADIPSDADSFLNSVIPREMAKYFFFDGEQAEAFSSETNYKAVGSAIRTILGCDVAHTAMQDLKYWAKAFDKELSELPGQEAIAKKEEELTKISIEREALANKEKRTLEDLEALGEQIDELVRELQNIREIETLQKRRTTLEKELGEELAFEKELTRRRNAWFSRNAIPLTSERLVEGIKKTLDSKSLSGIPSPYNEEFVRTLLARHKCICDRPLEDGTHEYGCVADLLNNAPSNEVQGRAIQSKAFGNQLLSLREHAWSDFSQIEQDRARCSEKIRDFEIEINGLSERLEGHEIEEVAEKEAARKKANEKRERLSSEAGALKVEVARLDREIELVKENIDQLALEASAGVPLVERRKLCDYAAEMLDRLLSKYEADARQLMENQINEILARTAHKDYRMEISSTFALKLLFSDGQLTPKSGGENQLLSLAFIAALVQFADQRSRDQDEILIPGTVAPLVLDSPFGQLDPGYKKSTAQFVPEMASQVVLLVSSSQGSADVLSEVSSYVGKEYVLISENKGARGERSPMRTTIDGTELPVTKYGMDRNMTSIEEVS